MSNPSSAVYWEQAPLSRSLKSILVAGLLSLVAAGLVFAEVRLPLFAAALVYLFALWSLFNV